MKHIFLLFAVLTLLPPGSRACTCAPNSPDNYCLTLSTDTTIRTVIMAEKVSDYHYGMYVRVISVLSGLTPPDTLLVWGDHGGLCRVYTASFGNGDTLILALQQCDTFGNVMVNPQYPPNLESATDYQLSFCGVYGLRVNNGYVQGPVTSSSLQTYPLGVFLANSCLTLSNGAAHTAALPALYPNPACDVIRIRNLPAGEVVRVYSAAGQLVLVADASGEIGVGELVDGVYFVRCGNAVMRFVKL
ncbi:MAG: T9SS type A sorting domain-containing protein [Bacteroidetes bacterium]|nr:T9SS type A sorting domain-containing protein [Bacteroidota bacterium]